METRKFMLTVVSGDTINDDWLNDQLDGFVEALTDSHGNMAVGFDAIPEPETITQPIPGCPPYPGYWYCSHEKNYTPTAAGGDGVAVSGKTISINAGGFRGL